MFGRLVLRKAHRMRRRRMHGRGLMDFLKKAHGYIKDNKLISNISGVLADAGLPGADIVNKIAEKTGYGRRRHHRRGGALKLAGMGLSPAGYGKRRRHHRRLY